MANFTGFNRAIHNGAHVDANWDRFEAEMRQRRACKAVASIAILLAGMPARVERRAAA